MLVTASEFLGSISFIVPVFNHLSHTQKMLATLQASLPDHLDYEIIFVDDASTDGTRNWLKTIQNQSIKVLFNQCNCGYAATNNVGVRAARGDIIALLNNDLVLTTGWLEPMVQGLLAPECDVGLVGNIQYQTEDGVLNHAGLTLTWRGQLDHIRSLPANAPAYKRVFAVTGACVLLRRVDFNAVGGFNEQYSNGFEDIDLCFKLRETGKKIVLATTSRIDHYVSLSRQINLVREAQNGQLFFADWRRYIKDQLSTIWYELLTADVTAYADKLDGAIAPAYLETPRLTAQMIAEAMLALGEMQRARQLENEEPERPITDLVKIIGVCDVDHRGLFVYHSVTFVITDLRSICHFYIRGVCLDRGVKSGALTIVVNGLQSKHFTFTPEENFNFGIIEPILLPTIANAVQICTDCPVMLSHIVIDDHVVDIKQCRVNIL
jgi:GT2 family glycosyltransferase